VDPYARIGDWLTQTGIVHWTENDKTGHSPPLVHATKWCQVRVRRVVSTMELLSNHLKEQLDVLYNDLLSYTPSAMTGATHKHASMDDDPRTLRAISSVAVHCVRMVDGLELTYMDGTQSHLHGARGLEHKFPLNSGKSYQNRLKPLA
jgi:hypothetical protein